MRYFLHFFEKITKIWLISKISKISLISYEKVSIYQISSTCENFRVIFLVKHPKTQFLEAAGPRDGLRKIKLSQSPPFHICKSIKLFWWPSTNYPGSFLFFLGGEYPLKVQKLRRFPFFSWVANLNSQKFTQLFVFH